MKLVVGGCMCVCVCVCVCLCVCVCACTDPNPIRRLICILYFHLYTLLIYLFKESMCIYI